MGDGVRLKIDVDSGITEIVLDGSEPGNPLGLRSARALLAAVRAVPGDAAAVILRGEGANFCVGGRIGDFSAPQRRPEHIATIVDDVHTAIASLRALQIPVISALHGWVAGGGIGLGLSADIVVCAESTLFRPAYSSIALAPDCGTSWHISRAFGSPRAMLLMLTGASFNAQEALSAGLVSDVAADAEVVDRVRQIAAELRSGPAESLRLIKSTVRAAASTSLLDHLALERAAIVRASTTDDADEGLQAFVEKRPAAFG